MLKCVNATDNMAAKELLEKAPKESARQECEESGFLDILEEIKDINVKIG